MATCYRKAELGRTRPPIVPGVEAMVHGVPSAYNVGVSQVISPWRAHQRSPSPPPAPAAEDSSPEHATLRGTATKNYLLAKTDIGKVRPNYSVPSSLDGGAAAASSTQRVSPPAAEKQFAATAPARSHAAPLNYVTMNRQAVGRGAISVTAQTADRQVHQVRRRASAGRRILTAGTAANTLPNITFGVPSKPSDSVGALLVHSHSGLHPAAAPPRAAAADKLTFGMTRATLLRQKVPPAPPAPLWTMPRFRDAKPAVESFRAEENRKASVDSMKRERPGLHGTVGHGVPLAAAEC